MASDLDLAMGIVQLTAVLVPLLLGITRYYLDYQDSARLELLPNRRVNGYIIYLFSTLFIAYSSALVLFIAHGNVLLTTAIMAYGGFLVLLFALIPYMLNRDHVARVFVFFALILLFLTVVYFFQALSVSL